MVCWILAGGNAYQFWQDIISYNERLFSVKGDNIEGLFKIGQEVVVDSGLEMFFARIVSITIAGVISFCRIHVPQWAIDAGTD